MKEVKIVEFKNYPGSVKEALDGIDAAGILSKQKQILVKPNLIENIPPPVTTPADCVSAIIDYIKDCSDAKIVIAEGCGAINMETDEVFSGLGYKKLAKEKNVPLMDLNREKVIKLENKAFKVFSTYYIPKIAMESFILSVPVLKAHSLAKVTLSLKNMMGFAPPKYYQKSGLWKKAFFHANIDDAIIEMNAYRKADMTLLDATVGLAEYHLGGKECSPHVNKLVAGENPVEVDKVGAELLGFNWRSIRHIRAS